MNTDDLISRLTHELAPVRPIDSGPVFVAKSSALMLGVVTVLLLIFQPRADLVSKFMDSDLLFQGLIFFVLFVSSLVLVSCSNRPGTISDFRGEAWGPGLFYFRLVTAALLVLTFTQIFRLADLDATALQSGLNGAGFACSLVALIAGLATCLLLIWKSRQGASTRPSVTGGILGLAALGFSGIAITLHCGNENGMHILLWHFLTPLVVLEIFGLAAGKYLLRW